MPKSNIPQEIIRETVGTEPSAIQHLGGTLNDIARGEVGGQRYFVKSNGNAPAHFFEAEAHGLELLSDTHTLRTPEIVAHAEANWDRPAYLILEWIDESPHGPSADFARR